MAQRKSRRQSLRKGMILASFLLFPFTINFFSPYLILESASLGTANGSFIAFALMFLASLLLGRLWCGWLCPGAGLQEACFRANSRRVGGRINLLKWAIWIPWVAAIAMVATSAGGYRTVDPLYQMENGLWPDRPGALAILLLVVALFAVPSLLLGKRAGCHALCWMAPFMILGRRLRNTAAWPALRLRATRERCADCGTCSRGCPMSLDVRSMVRSGHMENPECILCGSCVDGCPNRALGYSFSSGK